MMNRNDDHNRENHVRARTVVTTVFALVLLGFIGVAAWVWSGFYNVSALEQHTAPVYYVLDYALQRSIEHGAKSVERPEVDLADPQLISLGKRHYEDNCVQCHGAPGVARGRIGKSMTPVPSNLVDSVTHLSAQEVFWTIRHGIKMTGMPGWEFVFDETELWAVTAFVMHMPALSPDDYENMSAEASKVELQQAEAKEAGSRSAERGRLALHAYACTSCHSIAGIVSREVDTGPPLEGFAERSYIAGVLPNTFDNLVRWIRAPQEVDPLTAMPDLDVSEDDAAAMAVYLYEQGQRSINTAGTDPKKDNEREH